MFFILGEFRKRDEDEAAQMQARMRFSNSSLEIWVSGVATYRLCSAR